jgi:hypothetical protein
MGVLKFRSAWSFFTGLVVALWLTAAAARGQIYGIVHDTSELYTFSAADATAQLVGDAGNIFLAGLDFRPADGFLYGFNAIDLIKVDPRDATATVVGPHGLDSLTEGGFAITPDDVAYGLHRTRSIERELFTIDLDTGQGAVVAVLTPASLDINGLAWRNDGKLVGIDRVQNALIAIDPLTGSSNVVSGLTPSLGSVGGLAGDGRRGFFTTSSHGLDGTNELYAVDFFTGEHSLVGSLGAAFDVGDGISGLAFIPEPGTSELIAACILAELICARGRRWKLRQGAIVALVELST